MTDAQRATLWRNLPVFNRNTLNRRLRGFAYQVRTRQGGPIVSGPMSRVRVSPTAGLANVLINTSGGFVDIGEYVFFGHDVLLLTGTHDFRKTDAKRQEVYQTTDRTIVIERGAWIASRAVIIGPCRIGMNAVIGCGCVVDFDVAPDTVVRLHQEMTRDAIRYVDSPR
jgi:acetyltransferase-like isoleucine patch superfamily enzyme